MLVVIEVEDWEDNAGLLRELRMLQESQDRIVSDPLFDPEETDETLRIETEDIAIQAVRIVGTLDRAERVRNIGGQFDIRPLEA